MLIPTTYVTALPAAIGQTSYSTVTTSVNLPVIISPAEPGLSSNDKKGIGLGLGLGIPVVAAIVWYTWGCVYVPRPRSP